MSKYLNTFFKSSEARAAAKAAREADKAAEAAEKAAAAPAPSDKDEASKDGITDSGRTTPSKEIGEDLKAPPPSSEDASADVTQSGPNYAYVVRKMVFVQGHC